MIKHMISPGIGFSPGSVKFIVTRGLFTTSAPVVVVTFNTDIQKTVAFDTGVQQVVTFDTEVD